jgi:hypothetical protein
MAEETMIVKKWMALTSLAFALVLPTRGLHREADHSLWSNHAEK